MAPSSVRASERGPLLLGVKGARLRVRVQPGARRESVEGLMELAGGAQALRCKVTAAAEAGKANAALVELLARRWHLPKSALKISVGANAREKIVAIAAPPESLERIAEDLAAQGGHTRSRARS